MSNFSAITQTAQNIADHVKRTFGDEAGVQITDPDIIRWINMGQREILTTNMVNQAVSSTSIVGGQSDYDVSTLRILKIQSIYYNGTPLQFRTFQEAEEFVVKEDPLRVASGVPVMWYSWAGIIKLYPVPSLDLANGLTINYQKDFTPVGMLSDLLSIPDTYYNRLVEYVLSSAYELDEDSQNSQYKLSQMSTGLQTMAEQENSPSSTYPTITTLLEDGEW